jgi:hypothetical protein
MTPSNDPRKALNLGLILGQRRAFAAVAGRCSAAQVQTLRRIHDEKLYLAFYATWEEFCSSSLAVSRRHADRLIGLLDRFGPVYFEISQFIGISPREYLAIEPAIRENGIVLSGETISLIPDNAPKIVEAVGLILRKSRKCKEHDLPSKTIHDRLADLTRRGRTIANQLVSLYNSCHSQRDREHILESAMELRMILMQPGID